MLIVISIIVILIAMLLPSLKKARQSARYLTCAAQQRQVVQALIGYATDNKSDFSNGYWPSPTIIGQALDVLHYLQAGGKISRDYQYATSEGDAALRVFTCPDFPQAPGRGHSIYTRYDRTVMSWGPYTGWGNVGGNMDPNGSAVHTTYLYLGGIGTWSNQTNGTDRWHGWHVYDAQTYDSYDDPINGFGPVLSLNHRQRTSKVAILTDRMWIASPVPFSHPYERSAELSGGPVYPNHRRNKTDTIGGNVAFPDGHVQWRWENSIEERIHAYQVWRPYVCY